MRVDRAGENLIFLTEKCYNAVMTIKKPAKEGGATIADRFRLDAPAEKPKAVGGTSLTVAFGAALVALGVVALLTYMLYQHWDFLKGA